jgi:hypothetical protein
MLDQALAQLTREARRRGLNDAQWAAAAGLRKETLSRLRRRSSCDFATLEALASAVGARLAVAPGPPLEASPDGDFPARVDREYEDRLLDLCASGTTDPAAWRAAGPAFFMAGLAVMLAGARGFERGRYLALGEALHRGSSRQEVFAEWLARSPVRAARFLPLVRARRRRVA